MPENLIYNFNLEELSIFIEKAGFEKFRAGQVFEHLYKQRVRDFDEMLNLPANLREALKQEFIISPVKSAIVRKSEDGTQKFLFDFHDGKSVESVLIPDERDPDDSKSRNTLCVSTQIGCSVGCAFCATGKLRFSRNLETAEIIGQVLKAERLTGIALSNIVFMGMGEPMLNYDNTIKAVKLLTDSKYGLFGRRRITLSTSGFVPEIYKLADEDVKIKLAISLHATTKGLRSNLMPIAKKYPLNEIGDAVEYYYRQTKLPMTYEYIPFDGLNDSEEDVKRLYKFTQRVPSKVNIIPFHDIGFTNPTGFAGELKPSSPERFNEFVDKLRKAGVNVFVRTSSGADIEAACGQLAFSGKEASDS